MISLRSFVRPALVSGALALTMVFAVPTASADGTYTVGDRLRSIVAWSGTPCVNLHWTRADGSLGRGTHCDQPDGGVIEWDFPAVAGQWGGLEPELAPGMFVTCGVHNVANSQTLRENRAEYTATPSAAPVCLVHLD